MKKAIIFIIFMFVLSSFAFSATWQDYPSLNDDLISYYKFDNNTYDALGNANGTDSGTLTNVSGIINAGIYLNGGKVDTDDYASMNIGASNFTITFWAKDTGDTAGAVIASSDTSFGFFIGFKDSGNYVVYADLGANDWACASALSMGVASQTEYNFYSVVRNGSLISTYKNGVNVANSNTCSGTIANVDGNWTFGGGQGAGNLVVYLDEVSFWNRSLGVNEIVALNNSGLGLQYEIYNPITINLFNITPQIINIDQNLNTTINLSNAEFYNITWFVNGNKTQENIDFLYYQNFSLSDSIIAQLIATNTTINKTKEQNISKIIGQTIYFTANALNGTNISNFTITYSQGSFKANGHGIYIYNWNKTESYNFSYPLFAESQINLTTNVSTQNYNFIVYTTNSINFTFKDEETNIIINYTTVNYELIGDYFAQNYSTMTGYSYIDLITPDAYTIRYQATGYQQRLYYFQLINRTTNKLTLYLLNSSSIDSQVTIKIVDQSDNPLEDYFVKVLKYNIDTNSYETIEILQTNFEGETTSNIVLNTEFYQFIIENSLHEVVKITSPTYITKTSLTIPVQLGEEVAVNFHNEQDVTDDLTFNNDTNNFRYTFTDSNNIMTQACLYVYKTSVTGDIIQNYTCISSSSGTILIGITPLNFTTYRADAYIYFETQESFRGSYFQSYTGTNSFGDMGLLLVFILIITFAMIGIWSPVVALVLIPMPLFLGKFIGAIDMGIGVIISLQVVFIILAYVVGNKG